MKTNYKILQTSCFHNKNFYILDNNCVFFDIETTGFSTYHSTLYLIGCIYVVDGNCHAIQWLAENTSEEALILHEFFKYINKFDTIVHFNGEGFDIPYIEAKCKKYLLPYNFKKFNSIDIYKTVKPFKNVFKLENMKQKTLELYLDIQRTDKFSGGELISVYYDYCNTKQEELEDLLLQHNLDDIFGMISILDIFAYHEFFKGNYTIAAIDFTTKNEIVFHLTLPYEIPKRLSYGLGSFYLSAFQKDAFLKVTMYTEELKFFYPNYKDYYYLPVEDIAVHKCVAFYVDKNFRTKAKAATCYSKKTGRFLPQYQEIVSPYFKIDYHDKITYFEIVEEFLSDKDLIKAYTMHILKQIIK